MFLWRTTDFWFLFKKKTFLVFVVFMLSCQLKQKRKYDKTKEQREEKMEIFSISVNLLVHFLPTIMSQTLTGEQYKPKVRGSMISGV